MNEDTTTDFVPPTIDEDIDTVRRTHDFDLGDAPYQPEVLSVARAAERLADEVERLRGHDVATLTRIEAVLVEANPFVPSCDASPVLDQTYDGLPVPFTSALFDIYERIDHERCQRCDEPVGFVLAYWEGQVPEERMEWRTTALARVDGGPVRVLCEECAPYVPTEPEVSR